MLKFIHLADLHLDGLQRRKGKQVNQAIKESFQRAVDDALRHSVDCLLIAGDLFDHDHLTYGTERMLVEQFRRLEKQSIAVYYGLGNHDYDGKIAGGDWPENVRIFNKPQPTVYEATTREGVLYRVVGAGFDKRWVEEAVIEKFPVKNEDCWTLGLAHTGLEDGHYMPVKPVVFEQLGYDYFALGHLHARRRLFERVAFAGSLVGLDETETGARGGYYGQLDQKGFRLEPRDYSTLIRSDAAIDLPPNAQTLEAVESALIEALRERKGHWITVDLSLGSEEQRRLFLEENRQYLEQSLTEALHLLDLRIRQITLRPQVKTVPSESWPASLRASLASGALLETLRKEAALAGLLESQGQERLSEIVERTIERAVKHRAL